MMIKETLARDFSVLPVFGETQGFFCREAETKKEACFHNLTI